MTKPKRTMSKGDVQIVMAETFVHDVKSLSFSRQYNIIKVGEMRNCCFTIQDNNYIGSGDYRYEATVELYINTGDYICGHLFKLNGRVNISCDEENSPIIKFLDTISIKEHNK